MVVGENVQYVLPSPFLAGTRCVSLPLLKGTAPIRWLSPTVTATVTATACSGFQQLLLPLIPPGLGVAVAPQCC